MSVNDIEPAEAFVRHMARMVGLTVPDACLPGVMQNMALLWAFSDGLLDFPLPDDCEPASEYRP